MRLKYLYIVMFFLNSCVSYKFQSKDLTGVYLQQENRNIKLVINKEGFLHIDANMQMYSPTFKCCDTLSYGYWCMDNDRGFLMLSSPEELNTSYTFMEVEEKKMEENDSIYFYIDNPIEMHYKINKEKYRELFYTISITTNNSNFDSRFTFEKYDTNPIKLYNPNHVNIQKFNISIIPKCDIPVRNIEIKEIYTIEYEVKNPNSNVFKITLPQLDYGYISYRRLTNDYIKIVNKNKLMWDGKEYVKSP